MEGGMISVDKWSYGSQAYFLTHLHADHTAGLSSTWKRGPLYCSRLTARLFPCKFPAFDLSLLRILDIGTWHSLSLITPSSGQSTTVYVRAIDAHHCPGSVMYLFRGQFGCMLYTGDFRLEKTSNGSEIRRAMILDALKNEQLNIVYLDNTYCNPKYNFPPREVAAKQIIDIITAHPEHQIIIGIDSLGKEDLLLHISRELNTKIWVWPERLQIMHLLGFQNYFTTKISLTRIRAVPRYSFSVDTLEALNAVSPTIGIMPSGLPWLKRAFKGNGNPPGSSPSPSCLEISNTTPVVTSSAENCDSPKELGIAEKYHKYIYTVPYSDHSSFAEIQDFIELLRPVNIKGIVSSSSCRVDPLFYFGHLCGTKQALWRVRHKLEIEKGEDCNEVAEVKSSAGSTAATPGKKRRIDQVDFFGIRVSRVSLLRRLSRGVRITAKD